MTYTTLSSKVREMDAEELEAEAARLVAKRNNVGLNDEEQEALWKINKVYHQLTGSQLIVNTQPQLAS